MMELEFKAWDKIPRENPFTVTISEKIDGTNACIVIEEGKIIGIQSRKRFITTEDDNYGFAKWVEENTSDLIELGDGHHYGEWAGLGIQKNPLKLERKNFFLFNTFRHVDSKPDCCQIVPILFQGELTPSIIPDLLVKLKDSDVIREGVVVYYHAFRKYTKHTIITPNGKWHK